MCSQCIQSLRSTGCELVVKIVGGGPLQWT